uniref:G_PROTEIN_RECEP_F1_2 domain-containing protein n=1 Tax=Bursaphelenchus xylophilus TaxID=6326 RepID=A0A1I7RMD5_BURXY
MPPERNRKDFSSVQFIPDLILDSLYNKRTVFWCATLSFGWLLSVSVSISFLTLDRLLTLTLVHKYTRKHRHNMAIINVASQVVLYFVFILMQVGDVPAPDEFAPCFLYICVTARATNFLFIKLTLGLVNVVIGLAFFLHMLKYTKNRPAQQTTNLIGLFVVFNEFCLNFIPHIVSYVTSLTEFHIGKVSGPYTIYFFGLESSLLTIATLKVMGVPFSKNGLGSLQRSSRNNVVNVSSTGQQRADK